MATWAFGSLAFILGILSLASAMLAEERKRLERGYGITALIFLVLALTAAFLAGVVYA